MSIGAVLQTIMCHSVPRWKAASSSFHRSFIYELCCYHALNLRAHHYPIITPCKDQHEPNYGYIMINSHLCKNIFHIAFIRRVTMLKYIILVIMATMILSMILFSKLLNFISFFYHCIMSLMMLRMALDLLLESWQNTEVPEINWM